jgi:hypothetical protein
MKLYIIMFGNDAYLETIEYSSYKERYEKTKGIPPDKVYEEHDWIRAMNKVYELNR